MPAGLTAVGELSLAGEIRSVAQREQRLRAASDLGFTRCIGPSGRDERGWIAADTVGAAVQAAFAGGDRLSEQERERDERGR